MVPMRRPPFLRRCPYRLGGRRPDSSSVEASRLRDSAGFTPDFALGPKGTAESFETRASNAASVVAHLHSPG